MECPIALHLLNDVTYMFYPSSFTYYQLKEMLDLQWIFMPGGIVLISISLLLIARNFQELVLLARIPKQDIYLQIISEIVISQMAQRLGEPTYILLECAVHYDCVLNTKGAGTEMLH